MELATIMDETVNKKAVAMGEWFAINRFAGLTDVIVAYSSLTVFYNPCHVSKVYGVYGKASLWVRQKIEQAYHESAVSGARQYNSFRIPVCYENKYAPDLQSVSHATKLSVQEIIDQHLSTAYRVYMIGFLPGFAYMGELHPSLMTARKQVPTPVKAGSVAIVANQTGIYPLDSPGGWQIIGRTPLKLFDAALDIPTKLKTGDTVQFYQISPDEYNQYTEDRTQALYATQHP